MHLTISNVRPADAGMYDCIITAPCGSVTSEAAELTIEAACYANCDGSTMSPVLNIDDFTCFINRFADGLQLPHAQQLAHYANCDGSAAAPVLNIDDFTCFINAFALGCP
jgi:hypothetical protein